MKLRVWAYFFRQACVSMLNNRLVHSVSIGTITISMLFFGAFSLFFVNVNHWMIEWGESLSLSVYLEDGIDADARTEIEATLRHLPGAKIKAFVSKEKAKEELIDALGDQAGLLDALSKNPLPASYEVILKDVKRHTVDPRKIKDILEETRGVNEVQYSEQWLERFDGLFNILKITGIVTGSVLCIAVLFIITNTIKLMIYSRQDEIEISKIVGATDWFVKMPFLIEGAIQGLISGLLALLILFIIYALFSMRTIHVFGLTVMEVMFLPKNYIIFLLLLSLCLGLLGSFIAIGRFFKL